MGQEMGNESREKDKEFPNENCAIILILLIAWDLGTYLSIYHTYLNSLKKLQFAIK